MIDSANTRVSQDSVGGRDVGAEMHRLLTDLYPICRSITGNGLRETLRRVQSHIPLTIYEVPSGTQVFDWVVPKEWNIRDAYIANSRGERVVDFRESNLHVVGYSIPVRKKLSLAELREHLFTLPEHPDWTPFRTSFYKERWGFCLPHRQLLDLPEDEYDVCIDSSLEDGHLSYGEYRIPGDCPDEILISCHSCHPSLCNDNLSGIAVAVQLAKYLSSAPRRYCYRFVFLPATIGSITWLSLHETEAFRVKHGLVLTCVGDSGHTTYKKSRQGNAEIDQAAIHVLKHSGSDYEIVEFSPYGYDERQFCSPGFNLPVGCLMRTPNGHFPEYHTSADDLNFVRPASLADSLDKCIRIFDVLEQNRTWINLNPKGEPQLGKRGLYHTAGGPQGPAFDELALLWVLNLSDGTHSLLQIAERAGMSFATIRQAAQVLQAVGLLRENA